MVSSRKLTSEEVDALIHVSDISWTRKNIELNKEFLVGSDIEAMVVSVDKENQKLNSS